MIKFFRHIRQNMINENRASKYLLYAIGEIILVVIGILIALQINNWNETRKDIQFEKEILAQIRENLLRDRENLVKINYWQQRAVTASEKLVNDSIRNNNRDSIPHWLGDVVHFTRFQPLTNSYEALKSSGLQLVKNRDLRNYLGEYYDNQANRTVKALGDIEYAFNNEWLPLMQAHATRFEFQKILEVEDTDYFFEQTDAWRILMLNKDNLSSSIFRLENAIEILDKTLLLIPQDLVKLD